MVRPVRRSAATASGPDPVAAPEPEPEPSATAATSGGAGALASLSDLPVAGLTRRRIALLLAALVAAWVIVLFARQVGEASEATARADAMRGANVQLDSEVAALKSELALIQKQDYIALAAREYRLGPTREIPFALEEGAPPLASDAPGSAAARLGTEETPPTPLDSWAKLLFGDPGGSVGAPAGN